MWSLTGCEGLPSTTKHCLWLQAACRESQLELRPKQVPLRTALVVARDQGRCRGNANSKGFQNGLRPRGASKPFQTLQAVCHQGITGRLHGAEGCMVDGKAGVGLSIGAASISPRCLLPGLHELLPCSYGFLAHASRKSLGINALGNTWPGSRGPCQTHEASPRVTWRPAWLACGRPVQMCRLRRCHLQHACIISTIHDGPKGRCYQSSRHTWVGRHELLDLGQCTDCSRNDSCTPCKSRATSWQSAGVCVPGA